MATQNGICGVFSPFCGTRNKYDQRSVNYLPRAVHKLRRALEVEDEGQVKRDVPYTRMSHI